MKIKYLLMLGCASCVFVACQNESELENVIPESRNLMARSIEQDSIIYPLNPDDFPQKMETYSFNYDQELSEELSSLNEVRLRIRVVNAGNKNTHP